MLYKSDPIDFQSHIPNLNRDNSVSIVNLFYSGVFVMNTVAKLSIATACMVIADKLGSTLRAHQQASQCQQIQNENQEIATLSENYKQAANLLLTNYRLRDAQEQEVKKAINLINDSARLMVAQNKLTNIEHAKQKILQIYNAVK